MIVQDKNNWKNGLKREIILTDGWMQVMSMLRGWIE